MDNNLTPYSSKDLKLLLTYTENSFKFGDSYLAETEEFFFWIWNRSRLGYDRVPSILGRSHSFRKQIKNRLKRIIWSALGPLPELTISTVGKNFELTSISWGSDEEVPRIIVGSDRYLGHLDTRSNLHKIYIMPAGSKKYPQLLKMGISVIVLKYSVVNILKNVIRLACSTVSSMQKDRSPIPFYCLDLHQGIEIQKKFKKYLIEKSVRQIVMPYEAQPFQHSLIRIAKESGVAKVWGYVHSSVHAFPSFMIKRPNAPDLLITHGIETAEVLHQYCGWDSAHVLFEPTFRFKPKPSDHFENRIFLPYSFENMEIILSAVSSLFLEVGTPTKEIQIRIHPDFLNDERHKLLAQKILETLVKPTKKKYPHESISVFINTTSSILESLENGVENVFHISENPATDFYTSDIWSAIESKSVTSYVKRYSLLRRGAFIDYQRENESKSISEYIHENWDKI
ncbi:MAG: hypothetical protein EOO46_05770 [Flavobacterium sp.]|nr:MAG: hypothetical protein EOO46_05770 [Flavobacterium sp.]